MIPPKFQKLADEFPPPLRALLDAEIAAGNQIVSEGAGFPANMGGYLIMAANVTTCPRQSAGDLRFRKYEAANFCGAFSDARSDYLILEPPPPPEPEQDMDAIRAAHSNGYAPKPPAEIDPNTALGRFARSMQIDYIAWHDGNGYDLESIRAATPQERSGIEALLLNHGITGWRDVEALAALGTTRAKDALIAAGRVRNPEIQLAIARHAAELVPQGDFIKSLVTALRTAELYGGLSQALELAEEFHPKEVVDELFHGALHRNGETAVLFAALLMFIHGKAASAFDWDQRPFFLRFNTENQREREAAYRELREKAGLPDLKSIPTK